MQIRTLIEALRSFDVRRARKWVADATRAPVRRTKVARPSGMTAAQPAVAAGVVESLANRSGQRSPGWTSEVAESPRRIYLVPAAESILRLRKLCGKEGSEPLRKRQIMAPPEFQTVA